MLGPKQNMFRHKKGNRSQVNVDMGSPAGPHRVLHAFWKVRRYRLFSRLCRNAGIVELQDLKDAPWAASGQLLA